MKYRYLVILTMGMGTLGFGNTSSGNAKSLSRVVDVAPGLNRTCALLDSGKVYCWGANGSGVLGQGLDANELRLSVYPLEVTLPEPIRQISGPTNFVCALGVSGTTYCWGENSGFHLGRSNGSALLPAPVETNEKFIRIEAFNSGACGWTQLGAAHCWGNTGDYVAPGNGLVALKVNPNGEDISLARWFAGDYGITSDSGGHVYWSDYVTPKPQTFQAPERVLALTTDESRSCAITEARFLCVGQFFEIPLLNQAVEAWSTGYFSGYYGVTGSGLSSSGLSVCVKYFDGTFHCFGNNYRGILGLGSSQSLFGYTPGSFEAAYQPDAYKDLVSIRFGFSHACGLTRTGLLKCWGDNQYGQLGTRDFEGWGSRQGECASNQSFVDF